MERLDKVLAGTGRWSRREVKDLVRQGRVRIDGVTARTAEEKLDPDAAAISVDGQPVETERFTYVMLHKLKFPSYILGKFTNIKFAVNKKYTNHSR